MSSKEKYPTQSKFIFEAGDASPEAVDQWMEEADDYETTVNNVLTTVVLGALFQVFTFGMMIFAYFMIDIGLALEVGI